MAPVLLDGISELVFFLEYDLRPVLSFLVPENPAFVPLRLNHEDSVLRQHEVVNLRCRAPPVRQQHVMQGNVLRAKKMQSRVHFRLASRAFDFRGGEFEDEEYDCDCQEKNEGRHGFSSHKITAPRSPQKSLCRRRSLP